MLLELPFYLQGAHWPQSNNHKASELTWEIDNLYMIGVNGVLEVNDWKVPGDEWTDWSHHEDTDVTDGSIIDLNANFAFFRTQNAVLTGMVGYKRDNFGWESRGGDYVYSSGGFRNSQGSFADGELAVS